MPLEIKILSSPGKMQELFISLWYTGPELRRRRLWHSYVIISVIPMICEMLLSNISE